jgi:DNA-binding GntR family transcriptional regulator
MKRIEAEDLGRKVHTALLEMIVKGELPSGKKLIQQRLAERFGISRTPLIFAIAKLEREGLVQTIPRRGAFVRSYELEELIDICDVRCELEPLAARGAAHHATTKDIADLSGILDEFERTVELDSIEQVNVLDYSFRRDLLRACGNRFLGEILDRLQVIVVANRPGIWKPAEQILADHRTTLKAVVDHDPAAAAEAMRALVAGERSSLVQAVGRLATAAASEREPPHG